jgi:HSP20 family molecular chaperone IbpA
MNQIAQTNGDPARAEAMSAGPIFVPATDIIEKSDRVVMLLDVPGAEPTSLDVTLEKRVLTIYARINSTIPDGYAPAYLEFQDGTYERSFVFSEAMDSDPIDAALKDGVLRLTIPRAPDAGVKKIEVKTV